jgi:tRNA A64-2'-O-ribosylphosphate transferase
MAESTFPTILADLNFRDSAVSTSLYDSIKDIRRSTLSIQNRLRSIVQDALFVQNIASNSCLPLIANERCGSWYTDPKLKVESAYFKSTDGHHGQWSYSLRRLNLQVLSVIGKHGGAIIVDSTRRGKTMPDALLKTVPIWVAVMNRALFPERTDLHALQCPPVPDSFGKSEVSQIEARLDSFVTSFKELQLDLQALTESLCKPILVQWAVNRGTVPNDINRKWRDNLSKDQDCNLLILCSASHRVMGAEVSEGGYIQGAGDDSESWARGLTPSVFWKYQEVLIHRTPEEELPDIIARLIAEDTALPTNSLPRLVSPTSTLYIGPISTTGSERLGVTIDCNASAQSSSKTFLGLGCREGKLGSRDLRDKLFIAKDFVKSAPGKDGSERILVTCSTCKDLSAGVALMLLCLFYNDAGRQDINLNPHNIDKALIKKRIAWISASMSDVNPSRATLQSVNAFLMERPSERS